MPRKKSNLVVSTRTIERLSLYRRLLIGLREQEVSHVFSHQLADFARVTAAQVRRDLMYIGYSGSTQRGYEVTGIIESLAAFLDKPEGIGAALVGVGQLGTALLNYFVGRRPNLSIVAAFDVSPKCIGKDYNGCPCYPMEELKTVIKKEEITVAIVAVPGSKAQEVADELVQAGVRGILNFAPLRLSVPERVFVEDLDMTIALEKVAFYAQQDLVEY